MSTRTHPQIHESLLPHDLARLEYGRLLWRSQKTRERLLNHWKDQRHPYHERFQTYREQIERILSATEEHDGELNQTLFEEGTSLRALIREIPPVFGSFFGTSTAAPAS